MVLGDNKTNQTSTRGGGGVYIFILLKNIQCNHKNFRGVIIIGLELYCPGLSGGDSPGAILQGAV